MTPTIKLLEMIESNPAFLFLWNKLRFSLQNELIKSKNNFDLSLKKNCFSSSHIEWPKSDLWLDCYGKAGDSSGDDSKQETRPHQLPWKLTHHPKIKKTKPWEAYCECEQCWVTSCDEWLEGKRSSLSLYEDNNRTSITLVIGPCWITPRHSVLIPLTAL